MPMRAVRSGCEDGVEWVEQEDAIIHLLTAGSQCPQCQKEFKNAKGLNGMTVFGIDSIDIIGVIVWIDDGVRVWC